MDLTQLANLEEFIGGVAVLVSGTGKPGHSVRK
jgi:hypothetical protein